MEGQNSLEQIVRDYLDAFEGRNLEKCLDFYRDDAYIKFHLGNYNGKGAVEQWHRDRFDADMHMLDLEKISIDGNRVTVHGVITSEKLRAWKIKSLSGSVTFLFEDGKIREAKFAMRVYNPLEGW
jgi:hypothetical protein